jgi:hypothetical protein
VALHAGYSVVAIAAMKGSSLDVLFSWAWGIKVFIYGCLGMVLRSVSLHYILDSDYIFFVISDIHPAFNYSAASAEVLTFNNQTIPSEHQFTMIAAMFNVFSIEEEASRTSTAFSSTDYSFDQITESGPFNSDGLTYPLVNRVRSTLVAFPDTMPVLTPDCLSTGTPRQLVGDWWTCCGCKNLVNPALASERTCPICSHKNTGCCQKENVR